MIQMTDEAIDMFCLWTVAHRIEAVLAKLNMRVLYGQMRKDLISELEDLHSQFNELMVGEN